MVREKRSRPVSDRRQGSEALLKALIDAETDARKEKDDEHSRRLTSLEDGLGKLGIRVRHAVGGISVILFLLTWYGAARVLGFLGQSGP